MPESLFHDFILTRLSASAVFDIKSGCIDGVYVQFI